MEDVVYDRWRNLNGWRQKKGKEQYDFGEPQQAYKDIDEVIQAELDLIKPLVELGHLTVVKG